MATFLEKQIMTALLRDQITHSQAAKAFTDPQAWKFSPMPAGTSLRWWGVLGKSKRKVSYCWYTKRNEAGYFLGFREVTDSKGKTVRDQWTARKVKARLKELQLRRHNALLAKGYEKTR